MAYKRMKKRVRDSVWWNASRNGASLVQRGNARLQPETRSIGAGEGLGAPPRTVAQPQSLAILNSVLHCIIVRDISGMQKKKGKTENKKN